MDDARKQEIFQLFKECTNEPLKNYSKEETFLHYVRLCVTKCASSGNPDYGLRFMFSRIYQTLLKTMYGLSLPNPSDVVDRTEPVDEADRANLKVLREYFDTRRPSNMDECFQILFTNGRCIDQLPVNPFAARPPSNPFASSSGVGRAQPHEQPAIDSSAPIAVANPPPNAFAGDSRVRQTQCLSTVARLEAERPLVNDVRNWQANFRNLLRDGDGRAGEKIFVLASDPQLNASAEPRSD
ncbi:hypothetical protein PFICI_11841 [Pestalotiopsis fici W106-1]|uniref:Uncharacterized protein n=1 Tax=Pestalotiopsis fici (strain W106-1 / CGMCC3.15140) TaxID=1229662 RepID=W3WRI3_PESFW|nr:uncharacterized protein PFICI_11841 [Pestalotiopsis fici W106-1]ETS76454.1 hypothetical protein PFICI_11841 [Pestalotiopsis fici W106-1]